jgi:hypothetical protein
VKQVFDTIRQMWVAATPEEIVRQQWIQRLWEKLKFPKAFLSIEKELKELPHLMHSQQAFPTRRVDLLCYSNEARPLLLMEFKVEALSEKMVAQVLAYNTFVQAPAVAVANQEAVVLYVHGQTFHQMPLFHHLVELAHG